jgi:hypothetical protein
MKEFWIGVASSIVASALFLVLASVTSSKVRRGAARVVAWLARSDLIWTYKTKIEATEEYTREILRSRQVRLLSGRGNELQRDVFAMILGGRSPVAPTIKVILPDPTAAANPRSWLSQREAELRRFDASYGTGTLSAQIGNSIRFLGSAVNADRAEVRVTDFPHVVRILLTDNRAYVNSYPASAHGRESPVTVFLRGGPTYAQLERIFELMWANSAVPGLDLPQPESSTSQP